eukprot:TRINITY_DN4124_c0_g1_i1.p1 TRINITY_DN4124_c0_g1~~TRINITY_DN4124_c0_g1_i1.p1  ORF type:complete len:479 (-),score=74.99 TRINITY_DN4124_c0_g1_i1:295-1626(-)
MCRRNGQRMLAPWPSCKSFVAGLVVAAAALGDAAVSAPNSAGDVDQRTAGVEMSANSTPAEAAPPLEGMLTSEVSLGADSSAACRQHGNCGSCAAARGWAYNCVWCPLDHQCHPDLSYLNKCPRNVSVVDPQKCPNSPARRTNFSTEVAYEMTIYAEAAYYDDPAQAGHGMPEGFKVLKTFKEAIGTWQKVFGYVGVHSSSKKLVVAFRGTDSTSELVAELMQHSLRHVEGAADNVKVASYFHEASRALALRIDGAVYAGFKLCPSCELRITGHSLGAAMAAMFAAHWVSQDSKFRRPLVYTFGQPRVGNWNWARLYDEMVPDTYRVVNSADIVPHIPLCSSNQTSCTKDTNDYYHSGKEVWFPAGDYTNGVMCGYRECTGSPRFEDPTCSDGLVTGPFLGSWSITDHSGYWTVLPGYKPMDYLRYCGQGSQQDKKEEETILV